jgi:isocitrate dehydrogenase
MVPLPSLGNTRKANQLLPILLAWQEALDSEELDSNQPLIDFCNALEEVCIETVESG